MKFIKWLMLIAATIMIVTASAELIQPTRWDAGTRIYNWYYDLMGETGIQNGSVNLINYTAKDQNAYSILTFGASSVTGSNQSMVIGYETFYFVNGSNHTVASSGNVHYVNTSVSNNASWSCSQFVTKVNINSTLVSASPCSANITLLRAKSSLWANHSITTTVNVTGASASSTTTITNASYHDVGGNATGEDEIYRTRSNAVTNAFSNRFRLVSNVSAGAGFVLYDMVIPISNTTPAGAVDGTTWMNLTGGTPILYAYWGGQTYQLANGTKVS